MQKQEMEVLLTISKHLAAVRDRRQLWAIVSKELSPLVNFAESVVFVLDAVGEHYQLLLSSPSKDIREHPNYKRGLGGSWKLEGSPMKQFFQRCVVHEFSCIDLLKQFPGHPGLLMMKETGLHHSIAIPLMFADRLIGQLMLHFRKRQPLSPSRLETFRMLGQLVTPVVSNILHQEEIQRQSKEIEKLTKMLRQHNEYLIREIEEPYDIGEVRSRNLLMKDIYKRIAVVAPTDSTVLIMGETGTGKELIARAIHKSSHRSEKPLIKINCAALPPNLIESELFGHERGAFTGATDRRIGKFEVASGSTLFLDEIGELSPGLQAKLLRALQEREIERVGSNRVIKIDVRVIAATNRPLQEDAANGRFRPDLYYRLNVMPFFLPPLRERREDIPLLASHFLSRSARKHGKSSKGISARGMEELMRYHWPGNVRELEHVVERSVLLSNGKYLQGFNLPLLTAAIAGTATNGPVIGTLRDNERNFILAVLERTAGRIRGKGGAAELLDLPPTTLESKMKKLGIQRRYT